MVLDCFCGSGSTGVACAQLGLDFIGASRQETECFVAVCEGRNPQSMLRSPKRI
ncbi:DNA methyltransferase [Helicobacter vulpis]|uniref:DNA methyltransferase n=1 Tax=Helicobacter vulpis TaxID=2316076 RepID=UPI0038B2D542